MSVLGGRNLGVARGKIEIDVAALTKAATDTKRAGTQMERALQGAGRAAEQQESKFKKFGRTIQGLRGQIAGLGLATAGLSVVGFKAAAGLEEAQIKLKAMTGSLAGANKLMRSLRDQAREANIPISDMLKLSTMLLPTLEGNTDELKRYTDLVRRVAIQNPLEGLQGAAFAVNEAISSGGTDLVSLTERFQISRFKLRDAMQQTGGDFAAALDLVLDKMGLTAAAADEMGQGFTNSLRMTTGAFMEVLGIGFTPMLKGLTGVLRGMADWLQSIRDADPLLVQMGAGVVGFTAVLLPAVLLMERMAAAWAAMQGFGAIKALAGLGGGAVGAAAGVAAPAVAGAAIGAVASPSFINTIQGLVDRILPGGVPEGGRMQANFSRLAIAIENFPTTLVNLISNPANEASERARIRNLMLARGQPPPSPGALGAPTLGTGITVAALPTGPRFTQKQTDIIEKWSQDIASVESKAASQRLDAVENFHRTRRQLISSHDRGALREAEDFARQRTRAQEDLERSISDARESTARRIENLTETHNDKVADLREDGLDRLADIEQRANDRREDLTEAHKDNIAKAASRLDARAIIEENRSFRRQMKKVNRDEKRRTDDAKKQLKERLEDEKESHEKRLEAQREADEERIQDMRDDFERQQRLADEDRAIRNRRREEDHQLQLDEMDAAHGRRMEQINRHEEEEKTARNLALQEALADEEMATQKFIEAQKKRREAAEEQFDLFWDHILRKMPMIEGDSGAADTGPGTPIAPTDPLSPIPFARGGPVSGTTRALLHAGEYVLNPSIAESLRAMLGNFSQPELVTAVAGGNVGGNRNTSVRIAPGAIIVNEATRPGMTAREIEGALLNVIRRIA